MPSNIDFNTFLFQVTRVVLLWVNNHFIDFETDSILSEFLESFEAMLETQVLLHNLLSNGAIVYTKKKKKDTKLQHQMYNSTTYVS